jgi:GntR family transcriptional regulator
MQHIDPNNPTPLYQQVKQSIHDQIMSGDYPVGSHIPSENVLCDKFGVSRITVVRALNDLEKDGILQRIQGSGTIVKYPKFKDNLNSVQGFTNTMRSEGNITRSHVLSIETIESNEMLRNIFRLPADENEPFIRFRRLRFVNDVPAVIMTSIVRGWLGKRMQEYDLETASFYALFQEITNSQLIRNETTLTPILATPDIIKYLHVQPGSPHFLFTGIGYAEGNIPIEYNISVFHGSVFQFTTTIYKLRETNDPHVDGPSRLL